MRFSFTSTLSVALIVAHRASAVPVPEAGACAYEYVDEPDAAQSPVVSTVPQGAAAVAAAGVALPTGAAATAAVPAVSTSSTSSSPSTSSPPSSAPAASQGKKQAIPLSKPSVSLKASSLVPSAAPSVAPASSAVASATSPTSSSSGSSGSSSGKRGLAYNDASLTSGFVGANSEVSWAYNWAATTAGLSSSLKYIPMLWGLGGKETGWSATASAAIANGCESLLGFNEPDNAGQSNLSPSAAAAGWKTYMEPFAGKAKLGAPAVTNGGAPSGLTWLGDFLTACSGCTIDFVPVHWYDSATNLAYFKSYIESAYKAGGNRPIWITEFGASGSAEQQSAFLEDVMPWLDSLDWVENYAYFGVFANNLVAASGSSPSTLGETFKSYTSSTVPAVMAG